METVVQPPAEWRLGTLQVQILAETAVEIVSVSKTQIAPQSGERKTEESSEDNFEVVQPPADWRLETFLLFLLLIYCLLSIDIK